MTLASCVVVGVTALAAAARHGLRLNGVGRYRLHASGPGGLIFGYATLPEGTIAEGIAILADAVADVRGW